MSNLVRAADEVRVGIAKRAVGVLVRVLRRPGPWWACSGGVPRGSATGSVSDLIFLRFSDLVITSFRGRNS